jgi:hypothetical protein
MVNGVYGDIAVLVLDSPIDTSRYSIAELPHESPFSPVRYIENSVVWPVGVGNHDGVSNPRSWLKWNTAQLAQYTYGYTSKLYLKTLATDRGDSGGAIFVRGNAPNSLMTLGVLHGVDEMGRSLYSNVNLWTPWIEFYVQYYR